MIKGNWIELSFGARLDRRVPGWARQVYLADDGRGFVPAALAGNELMVMAVAGSEPGHSFLAAGGHAYAPADWMAEAFPGTADTCRDWLAAARALVAEREAPSCHQN